MLAALPVRSTMIINVPGFFVYICVVCLHEQMCLCVCVGTCICAGVHTCVCVWCGSLRLPPGVLPQLLYLLYIEVGSPWPETFSFDYSAMGIPHLYLPYWDHRWDPMPTHLFMRVLGFSAFVLAHSQHCMHLAISPVLRILIQMNLSSFHETKAV